MLVVADTSPLIALINIGHVEILPKLFGPILIPPAVAAELADPQRPPDVRVWMAATPAWLSVRAPLRMQPIADIDSGELAAINLAIELRADLLLIDENKGREAALTLGLSTARTGAVLLEAANSGVLADLKTAFDKLRATNFRIPPKVLDELLRQHERQKSEPRS